MFDVSFSELMLIGVIALIVIGPERLPKVARTIGHLLGRAQRYVNDVKSDIQREIDIKEIGDIKGQMEDAARSVKASLTEAQTSISQPLDEAKKALQDAQSLSSTAPSAIEPTPTETSSTETPAAIEPPAIEPPAATQPDLHTEKPV
ncbi:Sec-independent protein translocase protein TatB [Alcaligenaceae bacterium CGII-47]|nr:Sec-independent protein translocase protein TatB [Alcaligenaceae bacterium CGII-47]